MVQFSADRGSLFQSLHFPHTYYVLGLHQLIPAYTQYTHSIHTTYLHMCSIYIWTSQIPRSWRKTQQWDTLLKDGLGKIDEAALYSNNNFLGYQFFMHTKTSREVRCIFSPSESIVSMTLGLNCPQNNWVLGSGCRFDSDLHCTSSLLSLSLPSSLKFGRINKGWSP